MTARKGSVISSIFGSYEMQLTSSQGRYCNCLSERAQNAVEFYDNFLKQLIVQLIVSRMTICARSSGREVSDFFDRDEIQFAAIDGTCKKTPLLISWCFRALLMEFRREGISTRRFHQRYVTSVASMEEDVSIVAYGAYSVC